MSIIDADLERGILYLNSLQEEEAITVFDAILSSNEGLSGSATQSRRVDALYGKAVALARLNSRTPAKHALQELLQIRPTHLPAKVLLDEISYSEQSIATAPQLRLLVIHTFYDRYIESFYARHPELIQEPSQRQIYALLADGFAANHMYAPYMAPFGYDAQLIIANCPAVQFQWCREHGIREPRTSRWKHEILRLQLEHYKPHVIYVGDPIEFDTKFLREVAYRPALTVGWRAAVIPSGTDWSAYDLILSHLSVCREAAIALGAKEVAYFHPGTAPIIPDAVRNLPKIHDVVFSGGWTPDHTHRNSILTALAEASERETFSLALYLLSHHFELPPSVARCNHGERWGIEMFRVLRQGRIVVNAEINLARGEAGNSRLFEATSVGSFLLTEYHSNIDRYFTPGVEIETYRSVGEMLEKIRHYLKHPEEREAIAQRGRERCLREYSMESRCRLLDEIFRSRLARPSAVSSTPPPS